MARGLSATAALVTLLAGVPWLLLRVGWPLLPAGLQPGHHPLGELEQLLTTPDDGSLLLGVLTAVGWVAWASFALAVVVDVLALLRGRLPRRLPLLGVQQSAAGGLVASLAVLLAPPAAIAAPPSALSAPALVAHNTATAPPATPATAVATASASPVTITVQHGDTLWSIAEARLGDGAAYPRLADATRSLTQPDGRHLQDPDDIYPGWRVVVPDGSAATSSAPRGGTTPAPTSVPTPDRSAATAPTSSPSTTTPAAPAGTASPSASDSPTSRPTSSPSTTSTTSPAPGATATPSTARPSGTVVEVPADGDDEHLLATVAAAGLSGLTAAGLIALLRRRRTRQQRHRRSGQRLPRPAAAAHVAEHRLAASQDPLTVAHVDALLRGLARDCRTRGLALPAMQLIRLLHDRVELHLAESTAPVPPFTVTGPHDAVWTASSAAVGEVPTLDDEAEPAPYPTLAAVGTDLDGAQILIDLEQAGGLSVRTASTAENTGAPSGSQALPTAAVIAALVVELATTAWGEDLDVVCLDGQRDLVTALDVDRLRCTDDVPHLLAELHTWASAVMVAIGQPADVAPRDARRQPALQELLRPRLLILTDLDATSERELQQTLTALRATAPALPLTIISTSHTGKPPQPSSAPDPSGGAPGAVHPWTLTLDEHVTLGRLDPPSLTVHPHHLDTEDAQHVMQTLHVAAQAPSDPQPLAAPVPAAPLVRNAARDTAGERDVVARTIVPAPSAPPVEGTAEGRPRTPVAMPGVSSAQRPTIAVLGSVEVYGARGEISADRHRVSMLEAIAFLALHPHRERYALDEALWPGQRVPDARRQQLISRARRWLGTDEEGAPYLLMVNPHGYRLAPTVQTDWQQFEGLVGPSPATASTEDLEDALRLVRGQPFSGHNPRRYGWADAEGQDMIAAIVDVAHELAERAHRDGDAPRSRRAAVRGLLVEPSSELLWRDALGAEALAGNPAGVEALTDRFLALAEDLGGDLEPETEALLAELARRLPDRGLSAASAAGAPHEP